MIPDCSLLFLKNHKSVPKPKPVWRVKNNGDKSYDFPVVVKDIGMGDITRQQLDHVDVLDHQTDILDSLKPLCLSSASNSVAPSGLFNFMGKCAMDVSSCKQSSVSSLGVLGFFSPPKTKSMSRTAYFL